MLPGGLSLRPIPHCWDPRPLQVPPPQSWPPLMGCPGSFVPHALPPPAVMLGSAAHLPGWGRAAQTADMRPPFPGDTIWAPSVLPHGTFSTLSHQPQLHFGRKMESKVSEGGLNVTLTIRLLMHGKVGGRARPRVSAAGAAFQSAKPPRTPTLRLPRNVPLVCVFYTRGRPPRGHGPPSGQATRPRPHWRTATPGSCRGRSPGPLCLLLLRVSSQFFCRKNVLPLPFADTSSRLAGVSQSSPIRWPRVQRVTCRLSPSHGPSWPQARQHPACHPRSHSWLPGAGLLFCSRCPHAVPHAVPMLSSFILMLVSALAWPWAPPVAGTCHSGSPSSLARNTACCSPFYSRAGPGISRFSREPDSPERRTAMGLEAQMWVRGVPRISGRGGSACLCVHAHTHVESHTHVCTVFISTFTPEFTPQG